ncbi:hypothetical protein [Burkholderia pyrrocinia]|nr:hypothetical protein [Burkholderia pyrrocinia]
MTESGCGFNRPLSRIVVTADVAAAMLLWIRQFLFAAPYGAVPTSYPGYAHCCDSLSIFNVLDLPRERRARSAQGGEMRCLYDT